MFISPLVRQIVHSLRHQADRWERDGRFVRRDDGVIVQFIHSYDSRTMRPRLCKPRDVRFSGIEAFFVKRAIRNWLHRPL